MATRSRARLKGRKESGSFVLIPHELLESRNWSQCSPRAVKLFMDLYSQYKGKNNGDLCAAMGIMEKRGWTRSQSITEAVRELVHYGLVELTRQGGLNKPNLYAVTFKPVDDCKGKLDVPATAVASGDWKQVKPPYVKPAKKMPERQAF